MALKRRSRVVLLALLVAIVAAVVIGWQWYPIRVRLVLAGDDSAAEKTEALKALGTDAVRALIGFYEGSSGTWQDKALVGKLLAAEPYRRVAVLERSLDNDRADVRRLSAAILVSTNNADQADRILGVAEDWAKDRAFGQRRALVQVLASLANATRGKPDPRAVAMLVEMLESGADEDVAIRDEIARFLGDSGAPVAKDALVSVARGDPDPLVQARALQALGKMGWAEDMSLYERVAKSEETVARQRIAIALTSLARPGSEPILDGLIEDADSVVRRFALRALVASRSKRVAEMAEYLREDSFMGVRGDLSQAIQDLELREKVPVLLEALLETEPDDYYNIVRKSIQALNKLTGKHPGWPDEYFTKLRRDLSYEFAIAKTWWDRTPEEKASLLEACREEFGTYDRRPALLRQLRHASARNVARAARELHALDPAADTPGFTKEKLADAQFDHDLDSAVFLAVFAEAEAFRGHADKAKLLAGWDAAHGGG